ncbi:MAG: helix-turn-helix domain-containing protein [Nanoarchaeota archaeon]|nr:helix-turn-helix domain-containing protein [Nanoarchaeota archaeon]
MEIQDFEKIGLTKNQAKIYLSLIKLDEATAQQIMNESELHRSRVYDGLEKLQESGLVSFVVKDFKKYFQAAKPEKLRDYIQEQHEFVERIIPEINLMQGTKKEEINGTVYKGKEGLKTIHSQMLKEGKTIYVLGAKGYIFSELGFFIPNFERERIKKKIKFVCLWDNEEAKERSKNQKLIEGKILPAGYSSNGVVNIFGNKVAIVLWKERHPSGFIIESKEIADSYRKWFDLLWKVAK